MIFDISYCGHHVYRAYQDWRPKGKLWRTWQNCYTMFLNLILVQTVRIEPEIFAYELSTLSQTVSIKTNHLKKAVKPAPETLCPTFYCSNMTGVMKQFQYTLHDLIPDSFSDRLIVKFPTTLPTASETFLSRICTLCEPGSSVSIVTGRPGFDPRQGQRIFPLTSASRPALGPTQPPVQWVPGALSPGVKRGRGVMLTTHPLLVPRSRKSRSYTPSHPKRHLGV
jgi:hypothetical protein